MRVDKKGRVHVDLRQFDSMVEQLILPTEHDLIGIGYTLLDELLHQRTHYVEEFFRHRQEGNGNKHLPDFYTKKTELRQDVIDYMIQKGITLPAYMAQFLPQENEIGVFYHAGLSALRKHLLMTPRQLRYERVKYQAVIDGSADDAEMRERQLEMHHATRIAEKKNRRNMPS